MENFEIIAQTRTDVGKGASRRLRLSGFIPAIIYGLGKDPASLTIKHNDVQKHLEHEGFYSHILSVTIDGKTEKVVLKDLQRHPYKPVILHLDLLRVSDTQKIQLRIPLHFMNEENCVGVKQGGGVISHHLNEIEISCLPKDLPEFIEMDTQNVQLNDIIHLSDIVLPENVELVDLMHGTDTTHNLPVISVHLAKGDKADEEAEQVEEGEAATEDKKE
ncbi:MAG: 50S ribosomal protein L25/general stress protein Ctc [Thiomargarita sp.]|nr:50S ribosomal protein L25/general stress protein Ctc [Thiomargarita sp.]